MWNATNTALLRSMWEDKRSAVQIAAALNCGVSRNAVLGKVHRLRLSRSIGTRQQQVKPDKSTHRLGRPLKLLATFRHGGSRPPTPSAEICTPTACLLVTADELNDATCRWPIGDPKDGEFRYCGAPKHARVAYCAGHGGIAYQPRDVRENRRYHLLRLT